MPFLFTEEQLGAIQLAIRHADEKARYHRIGERGYDESNRWRKRASREAERALEFEFVRDTLKQLIGEG